MNVLAVGAHFDDVELNCLGYIFRLKEEGHKIFLVVATDGRTAGDPAVRQAEQEIVNAIVGYDKVYYLGYEDGNLQTTAKFVHHFDQLIDEHDINLIFSHNEGDFHQDHVAVARAIHAANRFSRASWFSYPSQDRKQVFAANCFVDISQHFDKKVEVIKHFQSQSMKQWLDPDVIKARNLGFGVGKYVERFKIEFLRL